MREGERAARVLSAEEALTRIEEQTQTFFEAHDFESIPKNNKSTAELPDDLRWLYTNQLSKMGRPARRIYDRILASPPHGLCPFCSERIVESIDHYLPKQDYPDLAITPCNLVPCCSDCNHWKATKTFDNEKSTLHPYYDDPDTENWLTATVVRESPPAMLFDIALDPSHKDHARFATHFDTFKLGHLYTTKAGQELAEISHYLGRMKNADQRRSHLLEQARSRRGGLPNGWKPITYQKLSESDWYVDGGYRFD